MDNQGFLNVDGKSLEYQWIFGDSSKPIIVLLHEGLGCVSLWKDFPKTLVSETGCGVFNYSRFGYAGSDPCVLPRSVDYMHHEADYLETVLAAIPGNQFVLLGHSDGASIATIYAGKYCGKNIDKLILIAPHFFVEELSVQSIAKVKTLFETANLRSRLSKYHGDRVDDVFWGWNDIWLNPSFRNWNICNYLDKVNVPLLLIQGDDDEYGSVAQIESAHQRANGPVQSKFYSDCGHSPHRKYETQIAIKIGEFIQS